MAGEVKVVVSIGDRPQIAAFLEEKFRKKVRHSPGACRRCMKNEDPDKVPPSGTMHKHCRCSWYWERIE